MTRDAFGQEGFGADIQDWAAGEVSDVDKLPGSQNADAEHSPWHAMCGPGQSASEVESTIQNMIDKAIANCDWDLLMRASHAVHDSSARGHKGCQKWNGHVSIDHLKGDMSPTRDAYNEALANSRSLIQKFKEKCLCQKK